MATIQLNGRITEDGGLDIELPPGLPKGEARVTIEIPIELLWRPEGLDRALEVVPMTGAEIVSAGLTGDGLIRRSPADRSGSRRDVGNAVRNGG